MVRENVTKHMYKEKRQHRAVSEEEERKREKIRHVTHTTRNGKCLCEGL